jgi:prepilin peptidase CpaA
LSELILIENGFVLLFRTFAFELRSLLLLSVVCGAAVVDVRTYRIPNGLIACGLIMAFAYHGLLPYGWGVFFAAKGLALGLVIFLPLYALRAMGAGDVKLMATVTTFLGVSSGLGAVLTTLIAGGVLAIGTALWKGVLGHVLTSTKSALQHVMVGATTGDVRLPAELPEPVARLPYAVAIAAGVSVHLLLLRSGNALIG